MPDAPQRESANKLLVTVAAKVDEDLARRLRRIAQRSGMKDGQLVRLILERVDAIMSAEWKAHINISVFIDHLVLNSAQLSRFFERHGGFEREERG